MAQESNEDGRLPLLTAGGLLREARLSAGLELEEIAARTRIARRHLEAIEDDRYADLASRAYAIGFSKTYAQAVNLDPNVIAASVREELSRQEQLHPRPHRTENFEPGDPARVPPSSLAWLAGLGAVVLFVLLFIFWRSFVDPAGALPALSKEPAPAAASSDVTEKAGAPTDLPGDSGGQVRLTALEDGVWIKVSNAAGEQIFQKELALNESFAVPAAAAGAMLSTARPDALQVGVGARTLARLRETPEILRDLPLAPASLLAPAATPPLPGLVAETSTVSER